MNPSTSCPACEEGTCLEHQAPSEAAPPSHAENAVTREELNQFRKKVAKSVKRLNRGIKEARRQRQEPKVGVEDAPEPQPAPGKRMSDAAKLGLGVFRSCKRK